MWVSSMNTSALLTVLFHFFMIRIQSVVFQMEIHGLPSILEHYQIFLWGCFSAFVFIFPSGMLKFLNSRSMSWFVFLIPCLLWLVVGFYDRFFICPQCNILGCSCHYGLWRGGIFVLSSVWDVLVTCSGREKTVEVTVRSFCTWLAWSILSSINVVLRICPCQPSQGEGHRS